MDELKIGTKHGHLDLGIQKYGLVSTLSLHGFKGLNDALKCAHFIIKNFRNYLPDGFSFVRVASWIWIEKDGVDFEYSLDINFDRRDELFSAFLGAFENSKFLDMPLLPIDEEERKMFRGLTLRRCFGKYNGSTNCQTCTLSDDCYEMTLDILRRKKGK